MRKIQRIVLENIQAHSYSVFDLHEGLNILSGPSESGKTSVLRALHWMFYDTWFKGLLRAGEDKCCVRVEYDDGHILVKERNRTGSVNRYIITYPNGETLRLDKFGRQVPDQVKAIHGMMPWILDEGIEINPKFRMLDDPPFLVHERGAIRAKAIGHRAGVHYFDAAIRSANTELMRLQKEERSVSERVHTLEGKVESYGDLGQEKQHIDTLKQHWSSLKALDEKRKRCRALANELLKCRQQISDLEQVVSSLQPLIALKEQSLILVEKSKSCTRAQEIASKLQHARKHIRICEALVKEKDALLKAKRCSEELMQVLERMSRSQSHAEKLNQARKKTDAIVFVKQTLAELDRLKQQSFELINILEERQRIMMVKRSLRETQLRISRGEKIIHSLRGINDAKGNLNNLTGLIERSSKIYEIHKKMANVRIQIETLRHDMKRYEQMKSDAQQAYYDLLASMDHCPLCRQAINSDVAQAAVSSICSSGIEWRSKS